MALPATPGSADVASGTLREVTFGGTATVTIPGRPGRAEPGATG
ncbi:MAG TPA: hypothetical protein VE733_08140 [Streptosporangiaceae bacterium]|nr:hypothetical protein [Streptosporangiaceae bacterium]